VWCLRGVRRVGDEGRVQMFSNLYSRYQTIEAAISHLETLGTADAGEFIRLLRAESARIFALMGE
jgi:hypothetical protein